MIFKHSIKGFSNYLLAKNGFVIRTFYVTNHLHYKDPRLISFKNNRIYLWSDSGKKERLSQRQLKRMLVEVEPVEIPLFCSLDLTPF